MATDKVDARAELAKMEAAEKAAADALDAMQKNNDAKRTAMLKELREADLADVKAKCKMHGFTASQLRGVLATKGAGKKAAAKSTPRKTTARKTTGSKRAAKST